jgi:hypothetical protein
LHCTRNVSRAEAPPAGGHLHGERAATSRKAP